MAEVMEWRQSPSFPDYEVSDCGELRRSAAVDNQKNRRLRGYIDADGYLKYSVIDGVQTISLPWPDSRLRPNARVHWSRKSKITKTARSAAFYIARAASLSAPADGPVTLSVTFYQPDNRHRDMDGCISQCKAYFDGLADAMRIDDRRFRLAFAWGAVAKPGRVDVVIGGPA